MKGITIYKTVSSFALYFLVINRINVLEILVLYSLVLRAVLFRVPLFSYNSLLLSSILTIVFVYPYLPDVPPVPLFISYQLTQGDLKRKTVIVFMRIDSEDRITFLNFDSTTYLSDLG